MGRRSREEEEWEGVKRRSQEEWHSNKLAFAQTDRHTHTHLYSMEWPLLAGCVSTKSISICQGLQPVQNALFLCSVAASESVDQELLLKRNLQEMRPRC